VTLPAITDFKCTEMEVRKRGLKFSGSERVATNLMPGSMTELRCILQGYIIRPYEYHHAKETLTTKCIVKGNTAYFAFVDHFTAESPICLPVKERVQGREPYGGEFT